MKKSVKAALLSALVFPGSGHFMLKRYVHSAILFGVTVLCLMYLIQDAVEQVTSVMNRLQSGDVSAANTQAIMQLLEESGSKNEGLIKLAKWTLGLSWVFGVVDAYRLGKIADKAN